MSSEHDQGSGAQRLRGIAWAIGAVAAGYLIAECVFSALVVSGAVDSDPNHYLTQRLVFEGPQPPYTFDPVSGYRLSREPLRFAMVSHDEVEYEGIVHGNNLGFPDRGDFEPVRKDETMRRYIVLGDSFSAASYLENNWPESAEQFLAAQGQKMELLNFSIHGGGIANWWSILRHLIAAENYEVDGIIFAVFGDDLQRAFSIADTIGNEVRFGTVPDPERAAWEIDHWPDSREEAAPHLKDYGELLSPDEYKDILNGDTARRWRPYLAYNAWLWWMIRSSAAAQTLEDYKPAQEKMIDEIAALKANKNWQMIVVRIPGADTDAVPLSELPGDVSSFAETLDAKRMDGRDAFRDLDDAAYRKMFFPYDLHWNQEGSDRFAAHFVDEFLALIKS